MLHADGTPVTGFPVMTDRYQLELNHPVPLAGAGVPRESLRVPAIGDVDGDRDAEIVATAGEHVYVWELDGTRARRFGADRALSEPCKPGIPKPCFDRADRAITSENHIKRGFISSPVLAQLDPAHARPRDRHGRPRPARLRVERRRHGAAGLPQEAGDGWRRWRGDRHHAGDRRPRRQGPAGDRRRHQRGRGRRPGVPGVPVRVRLGDPVRHHRLQPGLRAARRRLARGRVAGQGRCRRR